MSSWACGLIPAGGVSQAIQLGNFYLRVTESAKMQPNFAGYEAAKKKWIARNPNATPNEYQKAMRALAARYGV